MTNTAITATENLNVPTGVSRVQRDLYLTLTDEQKRTYRYEFTVCGRLAAHCYVIATTGQL